MPIPSHASRAPENCTRRTWLRRSAVGVCSLLTIPQMLDASAAEAGLPYRSTQDRVGNSTSASAHSSVGRYEIPSAPTASQSSSLHQRGNLSGFTILHNFPLHKQPDRISCGPTCCSMMLAYYGIAARFTDLKKTAGTRLFKFGKEEVGFTWPSKVKKTLTTYGLPAELYADGNLPTVQKLIDTGRPPILLVRSSEKTWHYVVATGHQRGRRYRISDPLGKQYWMSANDLDKAWAFKADLRGNETNGADCKVCGGNGKVGVLPCLFCGGDGNLPDLHRGVVTTNLIERVKPRTMIVPSMIRG